MFSIQASSVVCALVEKLLPLPDDSVVYSSDCKQNTQNGVVFNLDVDLTVYKENKTVNRRTNFFIAVTAHRNVFIAVQPPDTRWINFSAVPLEAWENTSNHDSCWRSDGIDSPLTRLYFEFSEQINNELSENGKYRENEVAPVLMHDHSTFNFITPFDLVKITKSKDTKDNSGYRKRIVSIEKR